MILYEDANKLEALLRRVQDSPCSSFYAEKFASLKAGTALEKIPFLTRQEIVETPAAQRLYINAEEVRFVAYTSGTTSGVPLVNYFGAVEHYFFEPSLGQPISKALITYPPLNKNFGHTFIQQCRQANNPITPVFADFQNLANSAIIAQLTRCDAVYATPTIALQLADMLDIHYDTREIKLLTVASELLTETKRSLLQTRYPNAKIANLYASSEIGQFILYPSTQTLTNNDQTLSLLTEALVAAELINNELVITYDLNPAFPLIRYRTGDYFDCNHTHSSTPPTLTMRGRYNVDVIRVNGFEIKANDVDAFCHTLVTPLSDHQLHISANTEEKIILWLEVVPQHTGYDTQILTETIKTAFLDNFYLTGNVNLRKAVAESVVASVDIRCVNTTSKQGIKRQTLINHLV